MLWLSMRAVNPMLATGILFLTAFKGAGSLQFYLFRHGEHAL